MTNPVQSAAGPVWAVIPAAGAGQRFSPQRDKLIASVAGLPLIVRTCEAVLDAGSVSGAIIVCNADRKARYQQLIAEYRHRKPSRFVAGGAERRASVYEGLLALPPEAEVVIVHDAARPVLSAALIDEGVARIQAGAAAVVTGVPITDTVKRTLDGKTVYETVDRSEYWRIQTPQFFRKDVLLAAHAKISLDTPVTDDAQLVELAGLGPVELLAGDPRNIKITYPEDISLVEDLLRHRR